jgi:hypothetical protein
MVSNPKEHKLYTVTFPWEGNQPGLTIKGKIRPAAAESPYWSWYKSTYKYVDNLSYKSVDNLSYKSVEVSACKSMEEESVYKSILDYSDGDSGREELEVDPDKLLSLWIESDRGPQPHPHREGQGLK